MRPVKAFAARATVVLAILFGVTVGVAAPAAAGTASFGWTDNPTLCATSSSCVRSGNIVRMWQSILYAEGLYGDIDGVFGPNTAAATATWQRNHGLTDDDGWVGPNTWKKADEIRATRMHSYDSAWLYCKWSDTPWFVLKQSRASDGRWWFDPPNTAVADWTLASW